MPKFNLESFKTLILNFVYLHSKRRKLGMFILFQKCQHNNHTIRKKEEEERKEQSRDLHDDIRGGLPIQILTLPYKA